MNTFRPILYANFSESITKSDKPYVLITLKVNRCQCYTVFGDVFQLLDRDNNGQE